MRGLVFAVTLIITAQSASAVVEFGTIERSDLRDQPNWPRGLSTGLDIDAWVTGETISGFGSNTTCMYYAGDAIAFQALLDSIKDGLFAHEKVFPRTVSLTLSPGTGRKHRTIVHADKEFDFDWSVQVSEPYNDEPTRDPPAHTVIDTEGRSVPRIVRWEQFPMSIPRVNITWYVGDGSVLKDAQLPAPWLLAQIITNGRSHARLFYPVKEPAPESETPEEKLGRERIEEYLKEVRSAYTSSQAAWRIADFYDITIDLQCEPGFPPRIRARHGDSACDFDIKTGKLLADPESFPPTATRLVQQWLEERRDDVLTQWTKGSKGEPIEMLPPLE